MTVTEPDWEQMRDVKARTAAQAAVEGLQVTPTGAVKYVSRGRVLVIGDEDAQVFATRIESPLKAQVLLTRGAEEPGVPVIPLADRPLTIHGHLGAFELQLGEPGKPNHEVVKADLVLDLGDAPLFDRALPPPGYWHFGTEPDDLDQALAALDGMVGTFEKPRFFKYDPAICAHSRSGQTACTRCIDACPAEAIISIGEQVEVNPNLCQGGGVCATVCPSGAMRYAYPGPADTLERVRRMLNVYREAGGQQPGLMVAAESDAAGLDAVPPNVLLLVVEELGSVGLEIWLAALAWGAEFVWLVDGISVPAVVREALVGQVAIADALLDGMGYGGQPVRLVAAGDIAEPAMATMPRGQEPATFGVIDDKRRLVEFAVDHFSEGAPQRPAVIDLPPGSPFGHITVNRDSCTLCMGCVSLCPGKALEAGGEEPRLVFYESKCVQCGICAHACPEQAIDLEPRYLIDSRQRRQAVVLCEQEPFRCVSCGKPFATQAVIGRMMERLAGHYMFQTERARRRLQMCEDCRVVDAVQDPDALEGGQALGQKRQ